VPGLRSASDAAKRKVWYVTVGGGGRTFQVNSQSISNSAYKGY
jgi:hypothetical protein